MDYTLTHVTLTSSSILSHSPFFAAVEGASRERLVGMGAIRRYPRGKMVFRDGEPCPGVFIVGTGLVRVYKSAPNGKEHVLHLVGPGDTFAEVAAIGGFACPANAEALEATICLLLPARQFGEALRQDHQLCLDLMASMARWVRRLVGQVEDIALRDAAGRVARYLAKMADPNSGAVRLPSLKRHLASHLNLTSETLSRTLRRLAETGLISSDEEGLTVLDRPGLEEIAEGYFPEI